MSAPAVNEYAAGSLAPEWSTFHIANNLGVTCTAGVTGSF